MEIDHIALAVPDLQEALATFKALYGLEPRSVETIESDHLTEATLPAGQTCIQVLEPSDETSSTAKFL